MTLLFSRIDTAYLSGVVGLPDHALGYIVKANSPTGLLAEEYAFMNLSLVKLMGNLNT